MVVPKMNDTEIEALFETLAKVDDAKTMGLLLEDLCTPREVAEMAQRLHVARLLLSGENYLAISQETGISATTIARVSRCLNYGPGGYAAVLKNVEEGTE